MRNFKSTFFIEHLRWLFLYLTCIIHNSFSSALKHLHSNFLKPFSFSFSILNFVFSMVFLGFGNKNFSSENSKLFFALNPLSLFTYWDKYFCQLIAILTDLWWAEKAHRRCFIEYKINIWSWKIFKKFLLRKLYESRMTSELITSDSNFFSSSALLAVAKILPNFGSRNLLETELFKRFEGGKYFRKWKKTKVIPVQFS